MYSPISKYLSLATMGLFLASAGVALANHGPHEGFIVCGLAGVVASMVFSYECKNQGAQPLTSLKAGREYLVEAVMATTVIGSNVAERLVVSWHVDYGHYEWRIAVLERSRMDKRPSVGDRLTSSRLKHEGGMVYSVVSPSRASGVQS